MRDQKIVKIAKAKRSSISKSPTAPDRALIPRTGRASVAAQRVTAPYKNVHVHRYPGHPQGRQGRGPVQVRFARLASRRRASFPVQTPARFLIHRERQREQDADMPHQRVRMCAPRERRARSLSIATDPHRQSRPRFPSPQVRPLLQGQEVRPSPRARPATPNRTLTEIPCRRVIFYRAVSRIWGPDTRPRRRRDDATRDSRRTPRPPTASTSVARLRETPRSLLRSTRACPRSRWGPSIVKHSPPSAHKSQI